MLQESLFASVEGGDRLHLRHLSAGPAGAAPARPALLLHGAIENSRIFYTEASGKGLGPFLARKGLDVYAADLRGRGRSEPPVSRSSRFGQTEAITVDLPTLSDLVASRTGGAPQTWIAHSWGGVLMLSALARFPELLRRVNALIFFGTKRSIRVWNRDRVLQIELYWKRLGPALARLCGYLPAREWRIGADNESVLSLAESNAWVRPGPWIDPRDGFDYGTAIRRLPLPPSLYIAGTRDACLGHPSDVRDLIAETGSASAELLLADFDHVDMLVGARAEQELFPLVAHWLEARLSAATG